MNEGRLKRLARLGGLTGRLTGHGIRERLFGDGDRTEAARDLAESLSQLKGAAMKVGQQIAVAASALDLPKDVQHALKKLERDAEPVPWWTIQKILERELEDHPDDLFASFDREPLGTASLAQAHAATLHDGRRVVVKVLHRGVAVLVSGQGPARGPRDKQSAAARCEGVPSRR